MVVGRPGLFETKTNSAQAEAGARAELGNMYALLLQESTIIIMAYDMINKHYMFDQIY